jgi:transposase-like protein
VVRSGGLVSLGSGPLEWEGLSLLSRKLGLCSREVWVAQDAMVLPRRACRIARVRNPEQPLPPATEAVLMAIREARFSQGVHCPRCGCGRVHRWGRFSGRQRYRCTGCARTFSDLTGTPAAYARKLGLWQRYSACLNESLTVRRSAALLGITSATAFRWRHRLLDALRERGGQTLSGWIELGSTPFAYSEKGRRRAGRGSAPAAARGFGPGPGAREAHPDRRVSVLVACDRLGHVCTALCGGRRPGVRDLGLALDGRLTGRLIVSAGHGRYGPGSAFARSRGGVFHDARPGHASQARRAGSTRRPDRGASLVHTGTVRAYTSRLNEWICRFRGVATKYLANYLIWHSHVDRTLRESLAAEVLRWPQRAAIA